MDTNNQAIFRKALLEQKADILNEANKTVEGGNLEVLEGELADTIDRSSAETDRNFTIRLLDRDRKLLKKINEALIRLDNGEFGDCMECGEAISVERLKARPVATLCIDCKEAQEQKEKKV